MANTWVAVARNSGAKIFAVDSPRAPLQELCDLIEPEARMHDRELSSDLPGQAFDGKGQGIHALGRKTGPKQHAVEHFAKRVGDYLERGRLDGAFDKLVIMAAPEFLGLLRKHLSDAAKALVIGEIDKNLVLQDAAAIREYLCEACPREFLK